MRKRLCLSLLLSLSVALPGCEALPLNPNSSSSSIASQQSSESSIDSSESSSVDSESSVDSSSVDSSIDSSSVDSSSIDSSSIDSSVSSSSNDSSSSSSSSEEPEITEVVISGPTTVEEGSSIQLTATVSGDPLDQVEWKSLDEGIASVDQSGLVTGVAAGEATIVAKSVLDSGVYGSYTVTVTEKEEPEGPDTGDGNQGGETPDPDPVDPPVPDPEPEVPEDPDVADDSVLVRFSLDGSVVGEKTYKVGSVLTLKDAPMTLSQDRSQYILWSVSQGAGEGARALNEHIALDETQGGTILTIQGERKDFDNTMAGEVYRKKQADGTVSGTTLSGNDWNDVLTEDLNLGNEYVGTPDNLITFNGYGYSKDLKAEIKAVKGKKTTYTGGSYVEGEYYDTVSVDQDDAASLDPETNYGIAAASSVHTMLRQDGHHFGTYQSQYPEKPVTSNGDSTIGLERPYSDTLVGGSDEGSYKPVQRDFDTAVPSGGESKDGGGQTNYCVTRITLTHDVVWTGELDLGGWTGMYGTNQDYHQFNMQGMIIGSYCELDLNGYNIIFEDRDDNHDNGFTTPDGQHPFGKPGANFSGLNSFGSITDTSAGKTGSIVMEEGTSLLTPMVLEDYQRPEGLANLYASNMAPFTSYRAPYLNATATFMDGSNLLYHMKFDCSGGGFTGINAPFAVLGDLEGYDGAEPMFATSAKDPDSPSYVTVKATWDGIPDLTEFEKNNIVNQRFTFDLVNTSARYEGWRFVFSFSGIDFSFDFAKTGFFIPHYFHFDLFDSDLSVASLLTFLPGSSLYTDEESSVTLTATEQRHADAVSTFAPESDYQGVGGLIMADRVAVGENLMSAKVPEYIFMKAESTGHVQRYYNGYPATFTSKGSIDFDLDAVRSLQLHPYQLGGHIDGLDIDEFSNNLESFKSNFTTADMTKRVRLYGSTVLGQPKADDTGTGNIYSTNALIRAFVNVPMIVGDQVIGDFASAFTDETIDLSSVADQSIEDVTYNTTWDPVDRVVTATMTLGDVTDSRSFMWALNDYSNCDNINLNDYVQPDLDGLPVIGGNPQDSLDGGYKEVSPVTTSGMEGIYKSGEIQATVGNEKYVVSFKGLPIPVLGYMGGQLFPILSTDRSISLTNDYGSYFGMPDGFTGSEYIRAFMGSAFTPGSKTTISRQSCYTLNSEELNWEFN